MNKNTFSRNSMSFEYSEQDTSSVKWIGKMFIPATLLRKAIVTNVTFEWFCLFMNGCNMLSICILPKTKIKDLKDLVQIKVDKTFDISAQLENLSFSLSLTKPKEAKVGVSCILGHMHCYCVRALTFPFCFSCSQKE